MKSVLLNIDVPDATAAKTFYCEAFDLKVKRRFGTSGFELDGLQCSLFVLEKPAGSVAFQDGDARRNYERHWTPVHFDIVVEDVDLAVAKAVKAGAKLETPTREAKWGKIAILSDPYGNGFCLVQFLGRGYDEIAD